MSLSKRRSGRSGARWILLFTLLMIVVGAAAYTVYDNGRVTLKTIRVTISNLPAALEGFAILQISDLQGERFGVDQRLIRDLAAKTSYDIVAVTGDFVKSSGDTDPFFELIGAFNAPVYVILGDADPMPDSENASDWLTGARRRGARILDATTAITKNGATVWLTPETMLLEDNPAEALKIYNAEIANLQARGYDRATRLILENAQRAADALEREIAAREQIQHSELHIIINHHPIDGQSAALINAWGASGNEFYRSMDAFIAGHLAGGQWRLPWLGAIYTPGRGFLPEDVSGFAFVDGWPQVISAGLGRSSDTPFPWFRLFNSPELTRIVFTRQGDVL
jgi:predicted MPP superfamily phosphohydrolase